MNFHLLCDLFPRISGEEYVKFKQDIRDHGLRVPIVTFRGEIVDGRNRYLACQEVGVEPRYQEFDGDVDDLTAHVVSLNFSRRHLNESQRAMVAARLADMPSHRPNKSANLQTSTRAVAAKMANVSERTVNTAKKVQQDGVPELSAAVDAGKVSVSAAAAVADLPKPQQREAVQTNTIKQLAKTIRDESKRELMKDRPAPAKAVEIAKDTGAVVMDNTGRFQSGASPEAVELSRLRLDTERAIRVIATTTLTAAQAGENTAAYVYDNVLSDSRKALAWLSTFIENLEKRGNPDAKKLVNE